jgi:hypothetical protein
VIKRVRGIPRQFRFPWRTPSQVEREVSEELEFHLAMRAAELERSGLSPDDAQREARRRFGNVDAARRELARSGQRGERQARWRTMIEDCWRDVRYSARSLASSPGFTAVAVIVLAVGIGATAAAFSLVNVLLVRPVLVENPDEVVAIYARGVEPPTGWSGFSYPEYADLRDLSRTFSDLAAFTPRDVGLAEDGITRRMRTDFVSANYFRTLGVPVARGREFTAAEETSAGDAAVAIVSYAYWVRHGRDAGMLGSVLQLNGEPVAVVGITAERFTGHNPIAPELWMPLGLVERFGGSALPGMGSRLDDRQNRWTLPTLFGRIDAQSSRAEADSEFEILAARLHAQYPPADGIRQGYVTAPLPRFSSGNAPEGDQDRTFVAVLAGVLTGLSGVVLLIACINLANMFLARGAGRRTEIAIRQALGGGRLRLVRQLLVEGLILALAGGAAGLLVAYWAVRGLLTHHGGDRCPPAGDLRRAPGVVRDRGNACLVPDRDRAVRPRPGVEDQQGHGGDAQGERRRSCRVRGSASSRAAGAAQHADHCAGRAVVGTTHGRWAVLARHARGGPRHAGLRARADRLGGDRSELARPR